MDMDNNNSSFESNSRDYYTQGKFEVIDIIYEFKLNFSLGNVIKYVLRAGVKKTEGKQGIEAKIADLRKANAYLEIEINKLLEASKG